MTGLGARHLGLLCAFARDIVLSDLAFIPKLQIFLPSFYVVSRRPASTSSGVSSLLARIVPQNKQVNWTCRSLVASESLIAIAWNKDGFQSFHRFAPFQLFQTFDRRTQFRSVELLERFERNKSGRTGLPLNDWNGWSYWNIWNGLQY